ncbi:TetR/AcrR family transcriptional regulator [uncultured Ilumatobacter sp.]|jgi:AcrR family transcriptional regulator|uniref:TetR/AcrR family transcriptional regulator n=1 Tax=Ilumatobacter sp. TaxID=1967498 RepID=UPI0030B2D7BD|tara:strand:- start:184 stop:801 length:618 start_codon:yes stop_codon:yes gene_type:complete
MVTHEGTVAASNDRTDQRGDPQRRAIHAAAIAQFSERGFSATSMANIADAAGMSRPALYQYFRNKGDIYASAFVALFNDHVDSALQALNNDGTNAQRLDGFLQRFEGDLWEQMAASEHSEEIMSAKSADTAQEIQHVVRRLRTGLATFLTEASPGRGQAASARRAEWAEVLELSPKGFKFDTPAVAGYRRRLTTLARSVAADIDA